MDFVAAKKCCNGCEIGQACSHAYTTDPPCAVENFNKVQQLQAKISDLIKWYDIPRELAIEQRAVNREQLLEKLRQIYRLANVGVNAACL